MTRQVDEDRALLELLQALAVRKYRFITPTPMTHLRVIARRLEARDLRDVFGWSLSFREDAIEPAIVTLMQNAGILERRGEFFASTLRVSSLDEMLFLHSAFPTIAQDSVFFGPDSYRFVSFLREALSGVSGIERVADIGAGTGVGGIAVAKLFPEAEIIVTDINPRALRLAPINAAFTNVFVDPIHASALDTTKGVFDLIIANPPYIADEEKRAYRDGGGMVGGQVSLDWTRAALAKLAPGGRFLLYTGSAIVGGENRLGTALREEANKAGCAITIREIDPDVFGDELAREAYRDVERIAVIGAVITKPS